MSEDNDFAAQAAKDREKDDKDRAEARKGQFDVEAEIARVRDGVAAAPAPGSDPESRTRVAKALAAQGIDIPEGYSVDPVTEEDREKFVADIDKNRDKLSGAAEKRGAASDSDTAPRGRTATNPRGAKAAEEK